MKKKIQNTTKYAFVTGASRGIGKAILEKLALEGYFIYGTYNTGKKEAKTIENQYPGQVKFYKVDFSKVAKLRKLIEKLQSIKFDLIVNNAGMFETEDFDNFDLDIWYKTLQVNLSSVLEICIGLKDSIAKNGSIVNISSSDGNIGSFASMSYAVSKAGITNLTKSLGNNFGLNGIRVNSIAPAWIDTSMATEESMEAPKLTPLKRNGTPEEVANVVYMLASDNCSFINGANIILDGGYTNVDYIMKKEAGL